MLTTWAMASGVMNAIYLPAYLFYGLWYAVPDVVLWSVAFGIVTGVALRALGSVGWVLVVGATLVGLQQMAGSIGIPAAPNHWVIGTSVFCLLAGSTAFRGRVTAELRGGESTWRAALRFAGIGVLVAAAAGLASLRHDSFQGHRRRCF